MSEPLSSLLADVARGREPAASFLPADDLVDRVRAPTRLGPAVSRGRWRPTRSPVSFNAVDPAKMLSARTPTRLLQSARLLWYAPRHASCRRTPSSVRELAGPWTSASRGATDSHFAFFLCIQTTMAGPFSRVAGLRSGRGGRRAGLGTTQRGHRRRPTPRPRGRLTGHGSSPGVCSPPASSRSPAP